MNRRSFPVLTGVFVATAFIGLSLNHANAQTAATTTTTTTKAPAYVIGTPPPGCVLGQMRCITQQMREDAAKRAKAAGKKRIKAGLSPLGKPDYFNVPNYALSPLPGTTISATTGLATAVLTPGIRKFVDSLPGIGAANHNNLGTYIPLALAIPTGPGTLYPGIPADGDYYEIGLQDAMHQFHSDLPTTTRVRSYRDMNPAAADTLVHYLGPIIIAKKDRPVRVKFTNELAPTSVLFLPVDTTLMGAGTGVAGTYSENRATLHLHGGTNPWISDGIPHQWITPAGDLAPLHRGVSTRDVPDMWWDALTHASVAPSAAGATNFPGDGSTTFYWANQQGSRLQFYHDHAYGLTRLNVYAGEAAGYLITDPAEELMIDTKVIPGANMPAVYRYGVPLILQDKSFVPSNLPNANFVLPGGQLEAQDPTWDTTHWGGPGNLWFPHVYTPNQNPADDSGANPFGRWDYGPWFWPPQDPTKFVVTGQPFMGDGNNGCALNIVCPGTPNPSNTPESYMDTMLVNGTAYPFLKVDAQAYRFRILNASNDRALNLSLFQADTSLTAPVPLAAPGFPMATGTEVKMIGAMPPMFATPAKVKCIEQDPTMPTNLAAVPPLNPPTVTDPLTGLPNNPVGCWPASWPTDGREGGVPDPLTAGPAFVQIGSEGGLLPSPVIIPAGPVNYDYNRRNIVVLNILTKGLYLMPAQRADVIVDFTPYAGKSIILYNDSPAPVPAFDPRIDYYTGDPDQTTTGGAPTTLAGWGPNTRTIMQFIVSTTVGPTTLDLVALGTALPAAYGATQPPPIVPEKVYDKAFGTVTAANTYARIQSMSLTWLPTNSTVPMTLALEPKAIQELFTLDYGRMNATLGVEIPNTNFTVQTTIPYGYIDPITETLVDGVPQLWKITHNGVDTHPVHFHLFNVQVINRAGWDGAIRLPDANEYGWKETVTMNPLEDVYVAFLPQSMKNLPFAVPDSIRLMDVTRPEGSTGQFAGIDQFNNPVTTTNTMTNFGWEYVWHCHILGHEENDFMRPMAFIGKATMVSPIIGSTLAGNSARFVWAKGAGVTSTFLSVGTTLGGFNLYGPGTPGPATIQNVTNLPLGITIYVRLSSVINGRTMFNDYTYQTPMFRMVSPAPLSTMPGTSATFTWAGGASVTQYNLSIGTTLAATDVYTSGPVTGISQLVTTLPNTGVPLYVRLSAMINGTWQFLDYTYTASSFIKAAVLTPSPRSILTGPNVTFSWSTGNGVTSYSLHVGTLGVNSTNLYSNTQATTSANVSKIPLNGSIVYVRLSSLINNVWQFTDYTYTAATQVKPAIISPTPGPVIGNSITFTWDLGSNPAATLSMLKIGTTGVGSQNVYSGGSTTATTATVNVIATGTIYVRLWAYVNQAWISADYTYIK